MIDMIYRKLTNLEVELLMNQGCRSDDWGLVEVADGFAPDRVFDTTFSGHVRLGACTGEMLSEGEIRLPAGIYRACIVSCTIGADVRIAGVRRCLAHCCIGDRVLISDVGAVYATAGRRVMIGDDARVIACGTLTDLQIGPGVELCHVEQLHRLALTALDTQCPQLGSAAALQPDAGTLPSDTPDMPDTSAGAVVGTAAVATEWNFMAEDEVDVFPETTEEPSAVPEAAQNLPSETTPAFEPAKESESEPVPEPVPEPESGDVLEPELESEPVSKLVSGPESAEELEPEPESDPAPELVSGPESGEESEPEPNAEPEPAPDPAPAPGPEPVSAPALTGHILPQQGSLFDEWADPSPTPVLADTLQSGYSPLNDRYAGAMPIAHALQARKVARMADAIGLNDRFLFTRELFKSNPQWYKECLEQIDACTSRKDAEAFVREKYGWKKTLPAAKKFYSIIERRFSENE